MQQPMPQQVSNQIQNTDYNMQNFENRINHLLKRFEPCFFAQPQEILQDGIFHILGTVTKMLARITLAAVGVPCW